MIATCRPTRSNIRAACEPCSTPPELRWPDHACRRGLAAARHYACAVTRPLRLLHTSDVHLGDPYEGAVARRAVHAFVDAAIANRADAVVFAGDTFDHARVEEVTHPFPGGRKVVGRR